MPLSLATTNRGSTLATLTSRVACAAFFVVATTGGGIASAAESNSPAEASATGADETLFVQLDADQSGGVTREEVPEEHHRLFDRLVRRGDADGNGQLSAEEFAKALTPSSSAKPIEQTRSADYPGAEAVRLLLLKLDTDRDGNLTRKEAPKELRSVFDEISKQADRNKNGELDRGELSRAGRQLARRAGRLARQQDWDVQRELRKIQAKQGKEANRFDRRIEPMQALRDPKQAASLFKRLDANGDNKLLVSELPERLQERVGRLLKRADTNRDGEVSQKEFVAAASRLARFLDK